MTTIDYSHIVKTAPIAFAYQKIIFDSNDVAIDYFFVEANQAFADMTGLPLSQIIGNKASALDAHIVEHGNELLQIFGNIAKNGGQHQQEHYCKTLDRWFKVEIFSSSPNFFSTLYTDIDKEKTRLQELDAFFSVNLDLLCIADTSGNFLKINTEWERILGYPIDQLTHKNFVAFVHPDDLPSTIEAMQKLKDQHKVLNFVNRYKTKNEDYRYLEWRAHPQGNIIYAAARDITNRIESEKELRISKERNQLLSDLAFEGLVIHRDGIILDANLQFIKWVGLSAKDLIGINLFDFIHPCDIPLVHRNILSETTDPYEMRGVASNGRVYDIEIVARTFEQNGETLRVIAIRDVTARKQSEQKLKESEEKYRLLVESTKDVIWILDAETLRFNYVSPSVQKLRGYTVEETMLEIGRASCRERV